MGSRGENEVVNSIDKRQVFIRGMFILDFRRNQENRTSESLDFTTTHYMKIHNFLFATL